MIRSTLLRLVTVAFTLAVLSGRAHGLLTGVQWTDPSGDAAFSAAYANGKTFVASVSCADTQNHTYAVTFTISWGTQSASGSTQYTTSDNFIVNCTWTGFQEGETYSLQIRVVETDTNTQRTATITVRTVKPGLEISPLYHDRGYLGLRVR